MTHGNKVIRILRWFEKEESNQLVGEEKLKDIPLKELQELFKTPETDLMYDCYPVTEKEVKAIQSLVKTYIDLKKYAYFVEADSIG